MNTLPPETPSVTVIIATRNNANTLEYAIKSVLWQTFDDFEVWIIGNNCTDHTESIVQNHMKDPRVHWYNLPLYHPHPSKSYNEGIKRAKGDYIAYLEDTDVWLPNHLNDHVRHLQSSSTDFGFSIMECKYSFTHADVSIPMPQEKHYAPALSTLTHNKAAAERLDYWKETHSQFIDYRVAFLKEARLRHMSFDVVPSLTVLRFQWSEENYHDVGPQPLFMEQILEDPDFLHKEMSALLYTAYRNLNDSPNLKSLKSLSYRLMNTTIFWCKLVVRRLQGLFNSIYTLLIKAKGTTA
ncbi:glycosyltransferase [Fulvivirga ulvae]|uniref:glycosyltransferase family 2 protein n=1 Tax=Fulvivirga ulvae TaxID=2904245 RepID=UPI001F319062|nr:glycosyltransferase family 2 protein [Fulvivirga ulvae]UII31435.1 glycosyltransferase [Fulvivirga ulvae]